MLCCRKVNIIVFALKLHHSFSYQIFDSSIVFLSYFDVPFKFCCEEIMIYHLSHVIWPLFFSYALVWWAYYFVFVCFLSVGIRVTSIHNSWWGGVRIASMGHGNTKYCGQTNISRTLVGDTKRKPPCIGGMELVSLSCNRVFISAESVGRGWCKIAIATKWYQFHTTDKCGFLFMPWITDQYTFVQYTKLVNK